MCVREQVRPLFIRRHNLAVVFAAGVTLLAKQDEFHGRDDSLLTIRGAHNISLLGRRGSSLRMRRADYAVPSWGSSCPSCKPYHPCWSPIRIVFLENRIV